MNNEPVAWRNLCVGNIGEDSEWIYNEIGQGEPLYTHPVKEQKCVVQDCENHQHEGSFNGDLCSPCFQFIAHGKGINSQAYRNTHPVKEQLTDEEILQVYSESEIWVPDKDEGDLIDFARAILRKAQEKC